jgi:hypothetical protein
MPRTTRVLLSLGTVGALALGATGCTQAEINAARARARVSHQQDCVWKRVWDVPARIIVDTPGRAWSDPLFHMHWAYHDVLVKGDRRYCG